VKRRHPAMAQSTPNLVPERNQLGLYRRIYAQYLDNPASVDSSWQSFFNELRETLPGS